MTSARAAFEAVAIGLIPLIGLAGAWNLFKGLTS